MQNFVELLKDHALILAAIRTLGTMSAAPEPQPDAAFETLRRLARLLEAHGRAEADFIVRGQEPGHEDFAALAAHHDMQFEDLVAAWEAYLARWPQAEIHADWPAFAHATGEMLPRLAAQVDAENRSLYPVALKYGLIRLLPDDMAATPH